MINEIKVKDVASYDKEGVSLSNLGKVNFVYGSNGSGKTTISEVLRRKKDFPGCQVFKSGDDSKVYVYNRNFVEENFRQGEGIKGIFTLGKDQKETMEAIEAKKEEIEKHDSKINGLGDRLETTKGEQQHLINEFKEECWKIKHKYNTYFKEAFVGYGNSKQRLMENFITMADNKKHPKRFEELVQMRESLYERPLVKLDMLNKIHSTEANENIELLDKKIVGAVDVDIADLITKLNISDWVLHGHEHMKNTDDVCPFCQQTLPENLEDQLNKYFDDTYTMQIEGLNDFFAEYESNSKKVMEQLEILLNQDNSYLNIIVIQDNVSLIKAKINDNLNLIESKMKEPSNIITLQDISDSLKEINREIERTNMEIKDYNALVINAEKAKKELSNDIWIYLCEQNEINYNLFVEKNSKLDAQIKGINNSIKQKNGHSISLKSDLSVLQKNVTNIEHSVAEINKRLTSFGFTNFKLDTAEEEGYYKIVRDNGEDVEDTLSEGEKTFITFLSLALH